MSFLRFNKVAQPAAPAANKCTVWFDTTANALKAVDANNNTSDIATFGGQSYRYLGFTMIQTGTTAYNSQAHGPATALLMQMYGGGGGGGGGKNGNTTSTGVGSGGGAGAYSEAFITLATLGYTNNAAMVVAVGAGGTNAANAAGGTGGTTSFNNGATGGTNFLTAPGGNGGAVLDGVATTAVASTTAGGNGGAAGATQTTGNNVIQSPGAPGEAALRMNGVVVLTGAGASTLWGTGGSGQANSVTFNAAGLNGSGFGSGGAGGYSNATAGTVGGNGAPGVLIIHEFA